MDVIDISAGQEAFDQGFQPRVPENTYRIAKVSGVEFKESRAGNPMFEWLLTIVDGTDEDGQGTDFKHWTVVNNASFIGFLNAIGINHQLTPDLFDEQGRLYRSKLESEALNRMLKVYITWRRSLKPDSEGKDQSELVNADYFIDLNAKRIYPVDPIGAKWDGDMSVPVLDRGTLDYNISF